MNTLLYKWILKASIIGKFFPATTKDQILDKPEKKKTRDKVVIEIVHESTPIPIFTGRYELSIKFETDSNKSEMVAAKGYKYLDNILDKLTFAADTLVSRIGMVQIIEDTEDREKQYIFPNEIVKEEGPRPVQNITFFNKKDNGHIENALRWFRHSLAMEDHTSKFHCIAIAVEQVANHLGEDLCTATERKCKHCGKVYATNSSDGDKFKSLLKKYSNSKNVNPKEIWKYRTRLKHGAENDITYPSNRANQYFLICKNAVIAALKEIFGLQTDAPPHVTILPSIGSDAFLIVKASDGQEKLDLAKHIVNTKDLNGFKYKHHYFENGILRLALNKQDTSIVVEFQGVKEKLISWTDKNGQIMEKIRIHHWRIASKSTTFTPRLSESQIHSNNKNVAIFAYDQPTSKAWIEVICDRIKISENNASS